MSRRRTLGIITRLCVAGIMAGILMMIQPWVFAFFKLGFLLLLFSTLAFIVVSHVPEPSSAAANPDVLPELPVNLARPENT